MSSIISKPSNNEPQNPRQQQEHIEDKDTSCCGSVSVIRIPGRSIEDPMNVWFNIDTFSRSRLNHLIIGWLFVIGCWLAVLLTASLQFQCYDFCKFSPQVCQRSGTASSSSATCVNFTDSRTLRSAPGLQNAISHVFQRSRRVIFRFEDDADAHNATSQSFRGAHLRFYNSSNSSIFNITPQVIIFWPLVTLRIDDQTTIPDEAVSLSVELAQPLPNSSFFAATAAAPADQGSYFTAPSITVLSLNKDYIVAELAVRYSLIAVSVGFLIAFILGHALRDQVAVRLQDFALRSLTKEYAFVIVMHVFATIVFADPFALVHLYHPERGGWRWWHQHGAYLLFVVIILFSATWISLAMGDIGSEWRKTLRTRAVVLAALFAAWYVVVDIIAAVNNMAVSELLFGFTTSSGSDDGKAAGSVFVVGRLLLALGAVGLVLVVFWYVRNRNLVFFDKHRPCYYGKVRARVLATRLLSHLASLFFLFYLCVGVPVQLALSDAVPLLGRTALGDIFVASVFGNLALYFFSVKSHRATIAPLCPHISHMRVFYSSRLLSHDTQIIPIMKDESSSGSDSGSDDDERSREPASEHHHHHHHHHHHDLSTAGQNNNNNNHSSNNHSNNNKNENDNEDICSLPVISTIPPTCPDLNRAAAASSVPASPPLTIAAMAMRGGKRQRQKLFHAAVGTARVQPPRKNLQLTFSTQQREQQQDKEIGRWTPENFSFIENNSSSGYYFTTELEKINFDDAHSMVDNARSFFCFETCNRALALSEVCYHEAGEDITALVEDSDLTCCTRSVFACLDACFGGGSEPQQQPTSEASGDAEGSITAATAKKKNDDDVASADLGRGTGIERSVLETELHGYKLLKVLKINDVQVIIALFAPPDAVGPTTYSRPGRWAPDSSDRTAGRSIDASLYSKKKGGSGRHRVPVNTVDSSKQLSSNSPLPLAVDPTAPMSSIPVAVDTTAMRRPADGPVPSPPPLHTLASVVEAPSALASAKPIKREEKDQVVDVELRPREAQRMNPGHRRRPTGSDYLRYVGRMYGTEQRTTTTTAVPSSSSAAAVTVKGTNAHKSINSAVSSAAAEASLSSAQAQQQSQSAAEAADEQSETTTPAAFSEQQEKRRIAHIAVAFRGTSNIKNAATDVDFCVSAFHEMRHVSRGRAAVHSGFEAVFTSLKETLFSALEHYLTLLQHRKFPVYFSGHSSGGAVACMAAYAFAQEFPSHPTLVYTFAQPRFCNYAAQQLFDAAIETYRVVCENDLVVRLPHCARIHVGREVVVDRDGNFIVEPNGLEKLFTPLNGHGDSIQNHSLYAYARCLDRIFSSSVRLPFKSFLAMLRDGELGAVVAEAKRQRELLEYEQQQPLQQSEQQIDNGTAASWAAPSAMSPEFPAQQNAFATTSAGLSRSQPVSNNSSFAGSAVCNSTFEQRVSRETVVEKLQQQQQQFLRLNSNSRSATPQQLFQQQQQQQLTCVLSRRASSALDSSVLSLDASAALPARTTASPADAVPSATPVTKNVVDIPSSFSALAAQPAVARVATPPQHPSRDDLASLEFKLDDGKLSSRDPFQEEIVALVAVGAAGDDDAEAPQPPASSPSCCHRQDTLSLTELEAQQQQEKKDAHDKEHSVDSSQ